MKTKKNYNYFVTSVSAYKSRFVLVGLYISKETKSEDTYYNFSWYDAKSNDLYKQINKINVILRDFHPFIKPMKQKMRSRKKTFLTAIVECTQYKSHFLHLIKWHVKAFFSCLKVTARCFFTRT